jgi:hypothetical protein
MDRRSVIRNIAYISVGAVILPACTQNKKRVSTALKNLKISGDQEQMLADLTQTILPSAGGTGAGAKELQSHLFALMMIDDCSSSEDQKKFIDGFKLFDDAVQKKYSTSFSKCSAEQKIEVLKDLEAKKNYSEDVRGFYNTVKKLTVQSYTSSQDYMVNVLKYNIIPGKYKGSVPVSQA